WPALTTLRRLFEDGSLFMGGDQTTSSKARVLHAEFQSSPDASSDRERAFDFVRVLYKRRLVAATTFAVVSAIMLARVFTQVPVYRASARLLLQTERPRLITYETFLDDSK